MKTFDAARGRWREILPKLGIARKFLRGRQMPCPACGGKDRFRFTDKNRDGMYFCNQCGAGNGFTLLMKVHGWDWKTVMRRVDEVIGNKPGAPMATVVPPAPEWEPPRSLAQATLWLRRYQPSKLGAWLANHDPQLGEWINRERPWGYYPEEKNLESAQHMRAMGAEVDWSEPVERRQ